MLGATRSSATVISMSLSGTATGSSTDYRWPLANISIPADQRSNSVTSNIVAVDDNDSEGTETIVVSGTVSGSTLDVVPAVILLNDDDLPTIALSVSPASLGEAAASTQVTVTATLVDGAQTSAVSVPLALAGTAVSGTGNDYTFTPRRCPRSRSRRA